MIKVLLTFIFIVILIILHEFSHYLSAKLLNLKINRIGFDLKPIPHCFIEIGEVLGWKFYVFMYAGSFMTVVMFLLSLYNNFWNIKPICWAFIIQLIIETNPFYSDFVISFLYRNIKYESKESCTLAYYKYIFSIKWYLHFLLWSLCIYFIIHLLL